MVLSTDLTFLIAEDIQHILAAFTVTDVASKPYRLMFRIGIGSDIPPLHCLIRDCGELKSVWNTCVILSCFT